MGDGDEGRLNMGCMNPGKVLLSLFCCLKCHLYNSFHLHLRVLHVLFSVVAV